MIAAEESIHVPQIVDDAIYHWLQWLHELPPAGPLAEQTCGSIEKLYALHIVQKLQAQYHPPEVKTLYDWRMGETMNRHIDALPEPRKGLIRAVHYHNKNIGTAAKRCGITRDKAQDELRRAYNQLAGKLCVR